MNLLKSFGMTVLAMVLFCCAVMGLFIVAAIIMQIWQFLPFVIFFCFIWWFIHHEMKIRNGK